MAKKTKVESNDSDAVFEEQAPVPEQDQAESVSLEATPPPSLDTDDQIGAPLEGEEGSAIKLDVAGFMERMEKRFVESAKLRNATLAKMNLPVVAATVNISLAEVREFRRNDKSLQQMTDLGAWAALRIALAKEIVRQTEG